MSSIIVIYDGECEFCINCISWVKRRLEVVAIPFQSVDLAKYSLTYQQCQKQVVVIEGDKYYFAHKGVIFLLQSSSYRWLAKFLTLLGPIAKFGYFQIANKRNSLIVKLLNKVLRRLI